jgi:serine/threonine-protein kinase
MGVVYKAEDPSIGRIVAIKTIRVADAATERERRFLKDRLFREARSAGMLNHAGIVTIYDIQEQGDYCYVFMEFVDGPTLEKLMTAGELDGTRILHVLDQAAAAIDYAHSRGIVHRDIKPANLMISSGGTVKVTDFGVAKFTSQQATNTGIVLGTPSYMSPEQIADQKITGASDQFSLAVIAYQLLTGERPFVAGTLPSLMFKIVNDEAVTPSRINPTLGAAVDVVLQKAMSKKPADRYADCKQFVRALNGALENRPEWVPMQAGVMESLDTVADHMEPLVLAGAGAGAVPWDADTTPCEVEASKHPRRLWMTAVGAAVLTAAVVGGGIWYWQQQQQDAGAAAPPVATIEAAPSSTTQQASPNDVRPSAIGPAVTGEEPNRAAAAPVETPSSTAQSKPPVDPAPPPVKPSAPPQPRQAANAAATSREPTEPTGKVRIVTNPPGARIIVDSNAKAACKTPCELELESGRHTLIATLDGYRSESRIFSTPQDTEQIIVLERSSGTIMVRSTPAGATIVVDGKERRERTPAILTLPVGKHKIAVVKEGFRREEQEIEIRDGAVTNLNITWTN